MMAKWNRIVNKKTKKTKKTTILSLNKMYITAIYININNLILINVDVSRLNSQKEYQRKERRRAIKVKAAILLLFLKYGQRWQLISNKVRISDKFKTIQIFKKTVHKYKKCITDTDMDLLNKYLENNEVLEQDSQKIKMKGLKNIKLTVLSIIVFKLELKVDKLLVKEIFRTQSNNSKKKSEDQKSQSDEKNKSTDHQNTSYNLNNENRTSQNKYY